MPSETTTGAPLGAARPTAAHPGGPLGRPLGADHVVLADGLLGQWQRRNTQATLPHAIDQVRASGVLDNFRRVAHSTGEPFSGAYPFADTDAYKTLEAAAYELARARTTGDAAGETTGETAQVRAFYEEAVALIAGAQAEDGYLSTYHQGAGAPGVPWADLAGGHELYNLGHLVQAALAAARRLGDDRLLTVARQFADLVVDRFGEDGRAEYCGHPQIETALVELYRETGHEPYLRQAELFVERRGSGLFARAPFGPAYYADHTPLRDLDTVTGHAVRMVYLAAGATDVAIERGDVERIDHLLRLWDDMVRTKSYVTGGIGSRHSDEAFGDGYELPSERAYAETCAAIGAMQWGWRLFLATGSAAVLDHVERVLYNGFAAGVGLDGTRFFYDNPLQRRPDHTDGRPTDPDEPLRRSWFGCACCPPNATRWVSQLQDHVALATPDGLTIALPAAGRLRSTALSVEVVTDYPWDGRITVRVLDAAADGPATLTVRVPGWATAPRVTVDGAPVSAEAPDGWLRLTRTWRPGQEVVLDLPMPARLVTSHPAVDATRGAVAAVRGPVVHCLEQADSPAPVDDVVVHAVDEAPASDILPDAVLRHALTAHVSRRPAPSEDPYPTTDRTDPDRTDPDRTDPDRTDPDRTDPDPTDPPASSTTTQVALVPYHLWANREPGAMRVWLRRT